VKQVILFGFISMVTYLIYLIVMYFSVSQLKFPYAMTLSLGVWGVAALYIVYLARKYIGA